MAGVILLAILLMIFIGADPPRQWWRIVLLIVGFGALGFLAGLALRGGGGL